MTDTQRIDRIESAVDRLIKLMKREYGGLAGWQHINTELELIRQWITGRLEPR